MGDFRSLLALKHYGRQLHRKVRVFHHVACIKKNRFHAREILTRKWCSTNSGCSLINLGGAPVRWLPTYFSIAHLSKEYVRLAYQEVLELERLATFLEVVMDLLALQETWYQLVLDIKRNPRSICFYTEVVIDQFRTIGGIAKLSVMV